MNILSLPNEIITEIGNNIILPADIIKFSLACKDFYLCRNIHLLTWVSRMKNVNNEINKIYYESNIHSIPGFEVSFRKYNGVTTTNYLNKLNTILEVIQGFQPEYITEYQLKRFNKVLIYIPNPETKSTDVVLSHDAFNKHVKCRLFTLFYDNLIL